MKDVVMLLMTGISLGIAIWSKVSAPQVAFVRTGELVNKYLGMQEASEQYQKKSAVWQAHIDSLKNLVDKAVFKYQQDSVKLSKEEKNIRRQDILKLQYDYVQYSNNASDKAAKEEESITQGVLNQVNQFLDEYGKSNHYSIIIGTTASGNVLYGSKGIDITEEVLEELNKKYKQQ